MEKKQVFKARSKEDGIVFRSNKIPALSYEVSINPKGKIETQMLPTAVSHIKEMEVLTNEELNKKRKVELGCKIAIWILAILSIYISKQVSIAFALIYFSITALRDLLEFCQLSFNLKLGKNKSTARFHAAEHKAVNAYKKKQGIPSMEEVKKASRFDKICGSRKYIDKILFFLLVSIVIALSAFVKIYVHTILVIFVLLTFLLEKKYGMFRFLQILVMNKPTDKELEVALAGIKFFDKMEDDIPEDECCQGIIIMAAGMGYEKK